MRYLCSKMFVKTHIFVFPDYYLNKSSVDLYMIYMPYCEKYKHNDFFYGARLCNQLPVLERKIDYYNNFKNVQKSKAIQI